MATDKFHTLPGEVDEMSRLPSRRPKFMGAKLKQIRECRHPALTQDEFALLVKQCLFEEYTHEYPELNREYISGYERGTRTVPPVILLVYAQLANVYVEVIMDDRLYFDVNPVFPLDSKFQGIKKDA